MSLTGRIANIAVGLVLILLAVLLVLIPEDGYTIVAATLGILLVVYGIRNLIYYFSMAMHMVGGKLIFYYGVLTLDGGALILALNHVPSFYVMLYLIVIRAVTGAIDLLRAMEQKKAGLSSWKGMLLSGMIHLLVAVLCVVFIKSTTVAVYIYAAGLVYSAIRRILAAIRPPEVITIL